MSLDSIVSLKLFYEVRISDRKIPDCLEGRAGKRQPPCFVTTPVCTFSSRRPRETSSKVGEWKLFSLGYTMPVSESRQGPHPTI